MSVEWKNLGRVIFLNDEVIRFRLFKIWSRDWDCFCDYFDVRWVYGYGRWVVWERNCCIRVSGMG